VGLNPQSTHPLVAKGTQTMSRAQVLFILSFLLAGCAALGPVSSPQFLDFVKEALPPAEREILMYGPGTWHPNTRGFTDLRSLFLSRPQEPIPGVLVVTTSALFVQQWDKANGRYEPMKRFSLNETLKVSLDTFGLNRRLVVQWKDFSTDSFSFTSDSGQTVDAERTEAAFQLLSSKLLSNGN
jgi:hypothetical protein